ncbi:GIY-YIG nuclease family protein [uncultured Dialister sp.]|uniref:GIY-YIG nuclease family protein n=1 Tax=Dialister hominis TaxID=2582419 RepID=UPI00266EDB0B|nr:GIY-YIG nuclease family protein [uncultured Dialister sp.]
MKKGIVYILTNPCLDGWVKIGMTERNDIEQRLKELNTPTNIPLSYRCYAIYEVENPSEIEKRIHSIIDRVDDSLHAREQLENGRIREREFFKISPETAYGIFKDIAAIKGNPESLKLYTPTLQQTQEQELAESKTKRSNNSFKLLNIVVGERIRFLYDDSIIAKVFDDKNQVEFEGVQYSVTGLAKKILVEKFGWSKDLSVNGWRFFMHNSIVLNDLRDEIEGARSED